MSEKPSHLEQGQIERARRLRQSIEKLKSGQAEKEAPQGGKSLKEQIAERVEQEEKER
jgi:hypothetical protein